MHPMSSEVSVSSGDKKAKTFHAKSRLSLSHSYGYVVIHDALQLCILYKISNKLAPESVNPSPLIILDASTPKVFIII